MPMHIPGYQYCGPGTKVHRQGLPVNEIDRSCREHDVLYDIAKEPSDIDAADRVLLQRMKILRSSPKYDDLKWTTKLLSYVITGIFRAKIFLRRTDRRQTDGVRSLSAVVTHRVPDGESTSIRHPGERPVADVRVITSPSSTVTNQRKSSR